MDFSVSLFEISINPIRIKWDDLYKMIYMCMEQSKHLVSSWLGEDSWLLVWESSNMSVPVSTVWTLVYEQVLLSVNNKSCVYSQSLRPLFLYLARMFSIIFNTSSDDENSHLLPDFLKWNIFYILPLDKMSTFGFIDILQVLLV